jgi:hypothetical protein
MDEVWRLLRDPRVSTTLVLGMTVLAGFALLGLGSRGLAPLLNVALQVPFLVSGGIGGLAVVGLGLALFSTHVDRTDAAAERDAVAALQRDVLRLLGAASAPKP